MSNAEMLGRMEALQLIVRRTDSADSRRLVRLTGQGGDMLKIARPVAEQVSDSLLQTLSPDEREALVQTLAKLRQAIQSK